MLVTGWTYEVNEFEIGSRKNTNGMYTREVLVELSYGGNEDASFGPSKVAFITFRTWSERGKIEIIETDGTDLSTLFNELKE